MASCTECDAGMHPLDAAEWEICATCRAKLGGKGEDLRRYRVRRYDCERAETIDRSNRSPWTGSRAAEGSLTEVENNDG